MDITDMRNARKMAENRPPGLRAAQQPIKDRKETKKKNSIALIASNNGEGCFLAWHGTDLFWEFQNESTPAIDYHGLDDAPDGLSIWEGRLACDGGSYEDPVPDCMLEGEFRDLTPEEWKLLQDTGVPWVLLPCLECTENPCDCDADKCIYSLRCEKCQCTTTIDAGKAT